MRLGRCGLTGVALACTSALAIVACGSETARSSTSSRGPSGTILVGAASSLTEAFERIADDFERRHPAIEVDLTFDASSRLAAQVAQGAPVDVFASADVANMDEIVDADLAAGAPRVFARNQLEIVTKRGNPEGVRSLADLAGLDVVALCATEAPCGAYAEQALDEAGVSLPTGRVTRGESAKTTLGAVAHGDAEAGIVYVTDVRAAGGAVDGVAIPSSKNRVAAYPIVVVRGTDEIEAARAFVRYVGSPAGQATLRSFGFGAP